MQLPIEWLPDEGEPQQLILLLHGWGADGRAMAPLAQALRLAFVQAAVLAPDAPSPCERPQADDVRRPPPEGGEQSGQATFAQERPKDAALRRPSPAGIRESGKATFPCERGGTARQWYGVDGLTPATWPLRVAAALPALRIWVRAQQQRLGVGAAATALGGFSQGAILALALALEDDGIAGRVLAFGGCFAVPPTAAPRHTTVHLFHGADDTVIPADGSRQALAQLSELQGDATLDIADGIGHPLHPVLIDCALHRLKNHIPLRTWQAALGAVAAPPQRH